MPTVVKHESALTSDRILTLPNSFEVKVCLNGNLPELEIGGFNDVLISAPLHRGGFDDSLQPVGEIQNPNQ